jgi:AraC-like DNA-binding protein
MLMHIPHGTLVWPAAMVVWGPGFKSAAHRHHCVQLLLALKGNLRIRRGADDIWVNCGGTLIRPDALHEVDARDATVLIAFVDAESELGSGLCERIEGDIFSIPPIQLGRWRALLGNVLSDSNVERWIRTELLNGRRPVKLHPNVRRVINYLREQVGVSDKFSLKTLAEISGLSQSRLMHVFTESVGVPLRPYILWLRLQRAACELMDGRSVTEAAHSAGFSDAAHLTRTFRRMLGTTPSDLALRKRMSTGVWVPAS